MKPQNRQTVFKLNDATFAYPYEEPVLKNMNLEIFEGDRVCILGANGCGKSTLFKIFAGLLVPQTGTFTGFETAVTEKELNDDRFSREYHKRVGFIFQDSDVQLFCSTVMEEIAFGPLQQGLTQEVVSQRVHEIAAMLEIENLIDKAPFKLSGGEKKKVALASVLVMNPEVLILDEPTNGLDPRTQMWLIDLLSSLNSAGKTIISSTHNLELVAKLSDRSILFSENHTIVADLPTCEVIKNVPLLKSVNLVGEDYGI